MGEGRDELRRRVSALARAGRLRVGPPLSEAAVEAFEALHAVRLPEDHRWFVTHVANGIDGVVLPLGHIDLDGAIVPWADEVGVLARAFPIDRASADDDDDEPGFTWEWSEGYPPGAMPIAYGGDTLWRYLVLTGPERGHVWEQEVGRFVPVPNPTRARVGFLAWVADELDARPAQARCSRAR